MIRAKAKLSSFQVGDRKRAGPFPPSAPYWPQKVNPYAPQEKVNPYAPQVNHPLPLAAPKPFTQPAKVNALLVFQSEKHIQCFGCRQFGHKKAECPNKDDKKNFPRPALPPQKQAFQNCNRNQPRGPAPIQPKVVKVNYVSVKEEAEVQAQIYAALDPSGYNRQYSILEAQGDYEGKPLTFLIDSRCLHSFISPNTSKRLRIEAQPTGRKLRVSLANGSSILTDEQVIELSFNLEGNSSSQKFRILKMGKFQGILGMDWLSRNQAGINCSQGLISFLSDNGSDNGQKVEIKGRSGKNLLRVVKPSKIIKGFNKGLPIYVLKLNKPDQVEEGEGPDWLSEYQDIFPEELTNLPPERELVHEIELIPGAQSIANPTRWRLPKLLN